MSKKPEIVLVGTGAVGSFYTGKLAQAGASVSFVCRSDFEEVSRNGVSIKSVRGDYSFRPKEVIRTIIDYSGTPDFIIVATKVLPEIDVPALIRGKVGTDTTIVLLQNGINIEPPVMNAFPDNEIISGLAFICVSRESFGCIDHQDYGRLVLGKYPTGRSSRAEELAVLFNSVDVNCDTDDDIITARWKKLVWNAPFNPMSVLAGGATTREMMNSPETLKLARNVMKEVLALAEKTGNPIDCSFIDKMIEDTSKMTPYKTSMLLDYEGKRAMEVEAILGNAVRLASQERLPVPHLESLYGLLTLINMKNIAS